MEQKHITLYVQRCYLFWVRIKKAFCSNVHKVVNQITHTHTTSHSKFIATVNVVKPKYDKLFTFDNNKKINRW